MFTLKSLWNAFANVTTSLNRFAATIDALSTEVESRCALPGADVVNPIPLPRVCALRPR